MYLTSRDLENVKSRFSFLLSSITWIIIESLKLALSMFESKLEVYAAAAVEDADGGFVPDGRLLVLGKVAVPPLAVFVFELITKI